MIAGAGTTLADWADRAILPRRLALAAATRGAIFATSARDRDAMRRRLGR